jgi:selenide,water dikinase
MGPEALAQVLRPLLELFPAESRPEILVGLAAGDDAAVYRLDDSRALVFTADFFTPVVDDPRDFGAVAAANALSDVYAMGGEPVLALNIASFPASLPPAVIEEVFRGGAEKAREAGCAVVGGHTIMSQEPTYGLAVVGFADPRKLLLKTGVRAGDALVLTKPIGVGVITTALKNGTASAASVAAALASMKTLNRDAARILARHGVRGCTDVTGFSLLGHGLELASKSAIGLRLRSGAIPLVVGTAEAADAGAFPGGTKRNRAAYEGSVRFARAVSERTRSILFSPETSGGLLAAVPSAQAEACLAALRAAGVDAAVIGETDGSLEPGTIRVD